jgi:hypothetical protein
MCVRLCRYFVRACVRACVCSLSLMAIGAWVASSVAQVHARIGEKAFSYKAALVDALSQHSLAMVRKATGLSERLCVCVCVCVCVVDICLIALVNLTLHAHTHSLARTHTPGEVCGQGSIDPLRSVPLLLRPLPRLPPEIEQAADEDDGIGSSLSEAQLRSLRGPQLLDPRARDGGSHASEEAERDRCMLASPC